MEGMSVTSYIAACRCVRHHPRIRVFPRRISIFLTNATFARASQDPAKFRIVFVATDAVYPSEVVRIQDAEYLPAGHCQLADVGYTCRTSHLLGSLCPRHGPSYLKVHTQPRIPHQDKSHVPSNIHVHVRQHARSLHTSKLGGHKVTYWRATSPYPATTLKCRSICWIVQSNQLTLRQARRGIKRLVWSVKAMHKCASLRWQCAFRSAPGSFFSWVILNHMHTRHYSSSPFPGSETARVFRTRTSVWTCPSFDMYIYGHSVCLAKQAHTFMHWRAQGTPTYPHFHPAQPLSPLSSERLISPRSDDTHV